MLAELDALALVGGLDALAIQERRRRRQSLVGEPPDELNRRLRADPAWREDTRFVVAHDEGDTPTWEGPDSMKPVVARIVKDVIGQFAAAQAFLFDR